MYLNYEDVSFALTCLDGLMFIIAGKQIDRNDRNVAVTTRWFQ